MLHKLAAIWLVLLIVSPATAPLSRCEIIDFLPRSFATEDDTEKPSVPDVPVTLMTAILWRAHPTGLEINRLKDSSLLDQQTLSHSEGFLPPPIEARAGSEQRPMTRHLSVMIRM